MQGLEIPAPKAKQLQSYILPEREGESRPQLSELSRYASVRTSASPESTRPLNGSPLGNRFISLLEKNLKASSHRSKQVRLEEHIPHFLINNNEFRLPYIFQPKVSKNNTEVLLREPKKLHNVLDSRCQEDSQVIKVEQNHFKCESLGVFPKYTLNVPLTKQSQERIKQSLWSCRDITASQIYRSLNDFQPESLAGYDKLANMLKAKTEMRNTSVRIDRDFNGHKPSPGNISGNKNKLQSIFKKKPGQKHIAITSMNSISRQRSHVLVKNKENDVFESLESSKKVSLPETQRQMRDSDKENGYNYNVSYKSPRGANYCDFYLPASRQGAEMHPVDFSNKPKKAKQGDVRHVSKFAGKIKVFKSELKSKARRESKKAFRQSSIRKFEGSQWNFNERRTASPKNQVSLCEVARRLRSVNFSANHLAGNPPRNSLITNFSFLNANPNAKNAKRSVIISEKESIWSQLIEKLLKKPQITAETMICYYEILGITCASPSTNDEREVSRHFFEKIKSDIVSELKFNLFFRPLVIDDVFDINPGR